MAGQPLKRAVAEELERRAIAELWDGESSPKPTAFDYVEDYIASGGTMVQLAAELTKKLQVTVRREMVRRVAYAAAEGADDRLRRARLIGAHALGEEAQDIVDQADATRDELTKAKLRADSRQWLAARWNRAELGTEQKSTNVSISIGSMHLDALRQRRVTTTLVENGAIGQLGAGEAASPIDAEVVEQEEVS